MVSLYGDCYTILYHMVYRDGYTIWYNVGIAMPFAPSPYRHHHFYGWDFQPFPVMGGLWHCYTHNTCKFENISWIHLKFWMSYTSTSQVISDILWYSNTTHTISDHSNPCPISDPQLVKVEELYIHSGDRSNHPWVEFPWGAPATALGRKDARPTGCSRFFHISKWSNSTNHRGNLRYKGWTSWIGWITSPIHFLNIIQF